jgi:hypothetical protein
MATDKQTETRLDGLARHVRRLDIITEESIYGTILVSGMIIAAGIHSTAWQIFLTVLGTVLIFWGAHLYAGTIAGHGGIGGDDTTLAIAFGRSLRRSLGFLTSAVPSLVILLLGALRVVPDALAIWIALWLGVLVLAFIGYFMFALRGRAWPIRILGALGTAAFGLAMILLKSLIH